MYLADYIAKELSQQLSPLLREIDLYIYAADMYDRAQSGEVHVTRLPKQFDHPQFRRMITQLENKRAVALDSEFRSGVWQNLSVAPAATAEEALSIVDPSAYVSFLSAMQRYGWTDRASSDLQMTTLADGLWRQRQLQILKERKPDRFVGKEFPRPYRVGFGTTLRGRQISLHKTKKIRETAIVRGSYIRISKAGSTIVDMLTEPQRCGGMRHVIDCITKIYESYEEDILSSVDKLGDPITKVRAGYIIEEIIGKHHDVMDNWLDFAQRGGSRRLDPQKPYGSTYSEKWMIATNVDA